MAGTPAVAAAAVLVELAVPAVTLVLVLVPPLVLVGGPVPATATAIVAAESSLSAATVPSAGAATVAPAVVSLRPARSRPMAVVARGHAGVVRHPVGTPCVAGAHVTVPQ